MLSTSRTIMARRSNVATTAQRSPPRLRRSVIVAFKEDERLKRDAEKQLDNALRGVKTAGDSPNNDPAGINHPPKDISEVDASKIGMFQTLPVGAFRAPGTWLLPAFTRRREVMAGRLAILGFAAAVGWEILSPEHPGPLTALSLVTGYYGPAITLLFLGLLAHGVAGAVWPPPGSSTYHPDNQRDVALRPKGFPDTFINPLSHPFSFLGISREWGFTKKNELFQGRLAMLGFLAACLGEVRSGEGAIAQTVRWFGSVPTDDTFSAAGRVFMAWSLFSLGLAWLTGNLGEIEGDESVY